MTLSAQMSLLDLMGPTRSAAMIERCDPNGPVVQGQPDEYLHLPRPGNANPLAEIELHRHTDGRWMWSASYGLLNGSGHSHKVGPKWGRFAANRDDALHYAVEELIGCLSRRDQCTSIPKIIAWARALQ